MPEEEGEELRVNLRLVGNVSGKVYSEATIVTNSLYKDPDVYLGYCYLAAPFTPTPSSHNNERPPLDPADVRLILQVVVLSANTVFNEHWLGSIERRPKGLIELPDPFMDK